MSVEVGQEAPDFTLRDQNGAEVTLSSFRGEKNVVVLFYPWAFTPVCQGELCSIRDDLSRFQNDDVQVLAISIDAVFSHKAWGIEQGYEFPLLSDSWPHGAVARAYGVFNEMAGAATRGTFVVDTGGIVRWTVVNNIPDARDQAAYLEALAGLQPA